MVVSVAYRQFWVPHHHTDESLGFEFGSTQTYDGSTFVQKSIALDEPVLYVAVNYRVGGFGFLAGQEVTNDGSTNLGLRDQRLGLQWVQDNIAAFGGDPTKVNLLVLITCWT